MWEGIFVEVKANPRESSSSSPNCKDTSASEVGSMIGGVKTKRQLEPQRLYLIERLPSSVVSLPWPSRLHTSQHLRTR